MNILNITGKKRESYKVDVNYSLLWECALGIAAITNSPLFDTLEKKSDFERLKKVMPDELLKALDYVEENNTWKSLLQLLHAFGINSNGVEDFTKYVAALSEEDLKYNCLPYLGDELQESRRLAAKGVSHSVELMKQEAKENIFFPAYIDFIYLANVDELKTHLIHVISLWYETAIQPQANQLIAILKRDFEDKIRMKEKLTSEEFVPWATGGTEYNPEPGVRRVLLIPQITYRPWTSVSDIEDTKVFYYPVPDENINPADQYLPNYFLIQKHKALGDEVRLRMIKLLSERNLTLNEITEQLDIAKSTVHHHLKILRASTLVGIKESKYYLKEQSLHALSKELDLYLNK